MSGPEFPAELVEKTTKALLVQWMTEAEAGTEDSPRGHCERLAHAVLAAVHDDIVQAERERLASLVREHDSMWGGMHPDDAFGEGLQAAANIVEAGCSTEERIARGTEAGR